MICLVTVVPAALALWGLVTQRWAVVVAAVGLYFLLVHMAKRTPTAPCKPRRLTSIPKGGMGETFASSAAPRVGGDRNLRPQFGGETHGCP